MKHIPLPYRKHLTARIRHGHPRLSNAVLMPANLLEQKTHYMHLVNALPTGSVLILTPPPVFSKQRKTLATAAQHLRSTGHMVTVLAQGKI